MKIPGLANDPLANRVAAILGLIGDVVLPLTFLVAWWWPALHSFEDIYALETALTGEAILAGAILAIGVIKFAKWDSVSAYSLIGLVLAGLWILRKIQALAYYVLTTGQVSPLLFVLVALAARYVGILWRRGSAVTFPRNVPQALIALLMLALILVSIARAHDAGLLPAWGRGSSWIGLAGFLYYGAVLGVRLLRQSLPADAQPPASRLQGLVRELLPILLAPVLLLGAVGALLAWVGAHPEHETPPSPEVTPEFNVPVALRPGMDVMPLMRGGVQTGSAFSSKSAPHCAEARALIPQLDENCLYYGPLQGWGQPEAQGQGGIVSYEVKMLDGAVTDYGGRRLLVLIFGTSNQHVSNVGSCDRHLTAVIAQQDARGAWQGLLRHQYFGCMQSQSGRAEHLPAPKLRTDAGILLEVPQSPFDYHINSMAWQIYWIDPQGARPLLARPFYSHCKIDRCANAAGACEWEGQMDIAPGRLPGQPLALAWSQHGIDPHGAFGIQGRLELHEGGDHDPNWRSCPKLQWDLPLHPAQAASEQACALARIADARLDDRCIYTGPLAPEEVPPGTQAGVSYVRQLLLAQAFAGDAGMMQALIFSTRPVDADACPACGVQLDAIILARERGDGWRVVNRHPFFATTTEARTAPIVSAEPMRGGGVLVAMRETGRNSETDVSSETLQLFRLATTHARALIGGTFYSRCARDKGWSWEGSVEPAAGNVGLDEQFLQFRQYGRGRDDNEPFNIDLRLQPDEDGLYRSNEWKQCG